MINSTPDQFNDLLDRVGWTKAYLADRAGVDVRTVQRWSRTGAPQIVITYLEQTANLINPKGE